jgi:hypothetical protein
MVKNIQHVRSTLLALALLFGLGSPVWASDVVDHGVLLGGAKPTLTTVLHEDFEDDALGALGAPWTITSAGGGSASIVNTTDHGHVLRLVGSSAEGSFLIATRVITSSSPDITTAVDIRPNSGAAFIWTLNGAGSSIGRRRIRLQQTPGSTTLESNTVPGGTVSCGALPSGAWTRVTLNVHTVSGTFDVLIAGAPTSCTAIATGLKPPFTSVSVMDASNIGWGGSVRFDNIDVTTP